MQSVCEIFAGFAEEEERSALAELIHEVLYEDRDSHRKLVVLDDNARRRAFLKLLEKQSELYSESASMPLSYPR
jgi:hypothetical protein